MTTQPCFRCKDPIDVPALSPELEWLKDILVCEGCLRDAAADGYFMDLLFNPEPGYPLPERIREIINDIYDYYWNNQVKIELGKPHKHITPKQLDFLEKWAHYRIHGSQF